MVRRQGYYSWDWLRLAAVAVLWLMSPRLFGFVCPPLSDSIPIQPYQEVRGQLSPASHHGYSLHLPESSLIRIIVKQDAPTLMLCVLSPAGKQLQSTEPRFRGESVISFAASSAGDYDILVAGTSADANDLTS